MCGAKEVSLDISFDMKNLAALIKILMPGEIRLVRHFYKMNSNAEERKRATLFELVINNPDITDAKAAKKLYDSKPNSAFSHLKARLKKDILNVLFLHDASKKFDSPYYKAMFEVNKILNQAFILRVRGAFDEAVNLLNSAATMAEKYELPAEQVLVQQALRRMIHRIKDEKVLAEYNESISKNVEMLEDLMKVEEFSYVLSVPSLFSTNKKVSNPAYREEMMDYLKETYEKTLSPKVGFWYYMTVVERETKLRNNEKALSLGLKFLKLVKESPSIYSDSNWAGVNMTVAGILIHCSEYRRAIGYARTAVKYFATGLMNELMATETLFFGQFRNKDYEDAHETVEKIFHHPRLKTNKFYHAKWLYLRANLEFMEERYDDAMKTLNMNTELTKDKSGWLLGYRLLEMMIMIENEDYEWVDFKIDSFRKLLERQKEQNIQRAKLIHTILNGLVKNHFDFEETSIDESRNYKALIKAQDELYWDPMGFEVIRFDEWFGNKVKEMVS